MPNLLKIPRWPTNSPSTPPLRPRTVAPASLTSSRSCACSRSQRLYLDLGVTSLAELKAAAKDDRIRRAKGWARRCRPRSCRTWPIAKSGAVRLHMHRAAALLEHAKQTLEKAQPEFKHLTIAGDFRRGCELVAEPGFSMTCFEFAGDPKVASAGATGRLGSYRDGGRDTQD